MFKMNHVHIKTKDPEKTAKFYVETMGARSSAAGGSDAGSICSACGPGISTSSIASDREQSAASSTSPSIPTSSTRW